MQYGTDLAHRKNSIIPVRQAGESCSDRAEISEIFPVSSLIINNNSIFSTFYLFIYYAVKTFNDSVYFIFENSFQCTVLDNVISCCLISQDYRTV